MDKLTREEEMKGIMVKLGEIWESYPDWRFGQLLSNMLGDIVQKNKVNDIFFPTNQQWLIWLIEYSKEQSMYNYGQNLKFRGEKSNEE